MRRHGRPSPRLRFQRLAALLCLWLIAPAAPALAGSERYGDITVSIGDAFAPATHRGYVAHEVTVRNDGDAARRVSLQMPEETWGGGDHLEAVSRSFVVEANGTVNAELFRPPLEIRGSSEATVRIDGVRQEFGVPFGVAAGARFDVAPAGFLVSRSVERETRSRLDAAVQAHNTSGGSASAGFSGHGSTNEVALTTGEPVEQWSRSWLGYTGFSAVIVSESDAARMPPPVAAALRAWTFAGGQLVIATASPTARTMPPGWPRASAPGDAAEPAGLADVAARALQTSTSPQQAVGLGSVTWWSTNAAERNNDGSAERWVKGALNYADAARQPLGAERIERDLPVVENLTTPVRGLVLMMLAFAILIGPVNVLLLAKFKRRMWLLWTVPLGSAVFSVGVIAFALLSEGIAPKARTQAVTYLDQTTREAVTIGMRGYYAPLTPGDGLRFPMSTKVVPQVEAYSWNDAGRGRSVDWTTDQHLSRGWVAARVPAHLELTDVGSSRLRLDVEELPGGGLAVTNGLGVDLSYLRLTSPAGARFEAAASLAAGARVELVRASTSTAETTDDAALVREMGWRSTDRIFNSGAPAAGTYAARIDGSTPFLADGLDGLAEHVVDAVVVGRYAPANGGGR